MPDVKKIKFENKKFEYDSSLINSYSFAKLIARAKDDNVLFFEAMERVFMGKDEEYAEKLGGDFTKLAQLFEAITDQENTAKN